MGEDEEFILAHDMLGAEFFPGDNWDNDDAYERNKSKCEGLKRRVNRSRGPAR